MALGRLESTAGGRALLFAEFGLPVPAMGLSALATVLPGRSQAREVRQTHKTRPGDSQTICSARKGLPVGALRDEAENGATWAVIGPRRRRTLEG